MQTPQTQMPPELNALLTLMQGMQQGRVAGATPEGQPTVAGQLMQQAQPAPPGVQDTAQRAGLGNQQQMAQQQAAMQQIPQQVQQLEQRQQALEQGIAGAPGAQTVRMAEGGIVGYAGGDFVDRLPEGAGLRKIMQWFEAGKPPADKPLIDMLFDSLTPEEKRAVAPALQPPAVPVAGRERGQAGYAAPAAAPAPPDTRGSVSGAVRERGGIAGLGGGSIRLPKFNAPAGGSADAMFKKADAAYEGMTDPTPGVDAVYARARQERAARRAYEQETGNDPDQQTKDIADAQQRAARKQADIAQQRGDLEYRNEKRPLTDFLINFNARKGVMGEGFASGAKAMNAGVDQRGAEGKQLSALEFQYQDAAAKEQQALRAAKLATDMGDPKKAQADLAAAAEFANAKRAAGAKLYGDRATVLQQSETAATGHAIDLYKVQAQAKMQEAENASHERTARIAADAASGRSTKNPYDVITDNVRQRFDAWLEAQVKTFQTPTTAQQETYRRQLLKEELDFARSMGVKVPDAPPGPSAAGGKTRIDFNSLPK